MAVLTGFSRLASRAALAAAELTPRQDTCRAVTNNLMGDHE
jgi:hypothetical protein